MAYSGVQQFLQTLKQRVPHADHPLMLALTTAVAVGIYIVSDPLSSSCWISLPCPILSQLLTP